MRSRSSTIWTQFCRQVLTNWSYYTAQKLLGSRSVLDHGTQCGEIIFEGEFSFIFARNIFLVGSNNYSETMNLKSEIFTNLQFKFGFTSNLSEDLFFQILWAFQNVQNWVISKSCNKITTTCQNWNGLLSNVSHQIMI